MEIELTKENYDGEVIKSNMPVLVCLLYTSDAADE